MTPRRDDAASPKRAKRAVEWDEANLAKNFAERSATMKIEEIETPWHSPPRELFHDLRAEDEEEVARRERAHEEVMRRLEALIRADARGETSTPTTTKDADATMGGRGKRGWDVEGGVSRSGREGRGFRGRRGGGGEEETVRREAKGVSVQGTGDGEVFSRTRRAIDRAGARAL